MNTKRRLLGEPQHELSRREFLRVAASAGAVGAGAVLLGGCGSDESKGSPTSTPGIVVDPPPETTTIRLSKNAMNPTGASFYVAEQFLAAEGFTNVQYIDRPLSVDRPEQIAAGEIDIGVTAATSVTAAVDRGNQLVILAGAASGGLYLFGSDRVRSLRDLKGKRIWVVKRGDAADPIYGFMAAVLGYVGIDIDHDVEFVERSVGDVLPAILDGTIDVWISTPHSATFFRTAKFGHVIIDCAKDPPWSQYFVGMATANRDFAEKHPAATKRALRAVLKATDVCAREPERAARYLMDRGFTPLPYDQVLEGITGVSYAAWREFNPEDTLRFYALRLKESGLVASTPDELIARATDWRYLNEIKRELGVA